MRKEFWTNIEKEVGTTGVRVNEDLYRFGDMLVRHCGDKATLKMVTDMLDAISKPYSQDCIDYEYYVKYKG